MSSMDAGPTMTIGPLRFNKCRWPTTGRSLPGYNCNQTKAGFKLCSGYSISQPHARIDMQ